MGESKLHIDLVTSLYEYTTKYYLNNDNGMLLCDLPQLNSFSKPPKVSGYIPDLFFQNTEKDTVIIGEAKTPLDLERKHTFNQFKAFLKECDSHLISYFILAVPWDYIRLSKAILKEIGLRNKVKRVNIVIPDQFII